MGAKVLVVDDEAQIVRVLRGTTIRGKRVIVRRDRKS